MATVRCPICGEEIIPLPVEREDSSSTQYICPSCRSPLTIDVIDQYVALEEEEASG
jgi:DNA-directed RNA polymerase subunit RPC12/RpoP